MTLWTPSLAVVSRSRILPMPLLPFQFPFAKTGLHTVHPPYKGKQHKQNKNKKNKKAPLNAGLRFTAILSILHPTGFGSLLLLHLFLDHLRLALFQRHCIISAGGNPRRSIILLDIRLFYFPLFTPLASIPWSLDIIPGLTSIGAQPSGINCPFEKRSSVSSPCESVGRQKPWLCYY